MDGSDPLTGARRVLVIDDNVHIHSDFRKILQAEPEADGELDRLSTELFGAKAGNDKKGSFEVDSASQGQEALEIVVDAHKASKRYALAFVDMRMPPGWNGVETVAELWKVDPDMQMVICTAYSDFSWAEVIETLGDTDKLHLLRKPFDPEQVRKIATVLATKWARLQRQKGAEQR